VIIPLLRGSSIVFIICQIVLFHVTIIILVYMVYNCILQVDVRFDLTSEFSSMTLCVKIA
jgi:hypothetical protein